MITIQFTPINFKIYLTFSGVFEGAENDYNSIIHRKLGKSVYKRYLGEMATSSVFSFFL